MLAKFGDALLEGTKESGSRGSPKASGDGNWFGAWLSFGGDWMGLAGGAGGVSRP